MCSALTGRFSLRQGTRLAISAVTSAAESVYDQVKNDGEINFGRLTADVAVGMASGHKGYIGNEFTGSFVKSASMLKGQIKSAFKSKSTLTNIKKAAKNYLSRTNKLYQKKFYGYKALGKGILESAVIGVGGYYAWR